MPDFTNIVQVRYPRISVERVNGKTVWRLWYLEYVVMTASADWLRRFEDARRKDESVD